MTNPAEERLSDAVAFRLIEPPFAFSFVVRGLLYQQRRTGRNKEFDLIGVRLDGGGDLLLENFETKTGCTRSSRRADLRRQVRQNCEEGVFVRVWGIWDAGPGKLVSKGVPGVGTIRAGASLGANAHAYHLAICEEAPRRPVTSAPLVSSRLAYGLRHLVAHWHDHVRQAVAYVGCMGCPPEGRHLHAFPLDVWNDYADAPNRPLGRHAWFCAFNPDRKRRFASLRHAAQVIVDGRTVAVHTWSRCRVF